MTGELKWGSILNSEGMVLSSHGENFGISLVEALSCAKPVLTTYKVGIYKDILKYKAGFISKDKPNDFAKILEKFKLERVKFNYYSEHPEEVEVALAKGANKASKIADEVLLRVRRKLGF